MTFYKLLLNKLNSIISLSTALAFTLNFTLYTLMSRNTLYLLIYNTILIVQSPFLGNLPKSDSHLTCAI